MWRSNNFGRWTTHPLADGYLKKHCLFMFSEIQNHSFICFSLPRHSSSGLPLCTRVPGISFPLSSTHQQGPPDFEHWTGLYDPSELHSGTKTPSFGLLSHPRARRRAFWHMVCGAVIGIRIDIDMYSNTPNLSCRGLAYYTIRNSQINDQQSLTINFFCITIKTRWHQEIIMIYANLKWNILGA